MLLIITGVALVIVAAYAIVSIRKLKRMQRHDGRRISSGRAVSQRR
jgi:hypothetical protein